MLLVDAGNTFIKWARPVPHQTFRLESVNWQNFGTVRHHEMAALKQAWHRLHEETPIRHVLISNVAGQQLENTLSGLLETLNPLPESVESVSYTHLIDLIVYELFGLNPDEIDLIERMI